MVTEDQNDGPARGCLIKKVFLNNSANRMPQKPSMITNLEEVLNSFVLQSASLAL